MKIPKRLKHLYEHNKKQIQERNIEFHDSFIEEHYGNAPAKRKVSLKLTTALSCIAVILITAILFAVMWKPLGDISDMPQYYAEMEKVRDSSLAEFMSDTSTITFDFSVYDLTTVTCIYDEASVDDLYYNLVMENLDTLEFVDLKVSINKYYHFQELFGTTTEYNTASVKSMYLIDVSGETIYSTLKIGDIEAYLTYTVYNSDIVTMYEAFIDQIVR